MVTQPQEIEDEEHEQVIERVAAIDVAKADRRQRLTCQAGDEREMRTTRERRMDE